MMKMWSARLLSNQIFEETQMGTRRIEDKRSSSSGWSLLWDSLHDEGDQSTRKAIPFKGLLRENSQGLSIDPLLLEDGNILLLEINSVRNQVVDQCLRH